MLLDVPALAYCAIMMKKLWSMHEHKRQFLFVLRWLISCKFRLLPCRFFLVLLLLWLLLSGGDKESEVNQKRRNKPELCRPLHRTNFILFCNWHDQKEKEAG
jgi:hypothetical protein